MPELRPVYLVRTTINICPTWRIFATHVIVSSIFYRARPLDAWHKSDIFIDVKEDCAQSLKFSHIGISIAV